jgi:uncharacterized protein
MAPSHATTPSEYPATERTTATRKRERMTYDADVVHAILDEAFVCHLGFVSSEGEPQVLPTLHVRLGDVLYVHGSTGSRPLRAGRPDGLPVCVTATLLDGVVYARSHFAHSARYRSVVAHGVAHPVTDPDEVRKVLHALVDKFGAGRADDSRAPTAKELAQTAVLALPLREVSAKVRTGGVKDEPEDYALPFWAGVVPLTLTAGRPVADDGVTAPLPTYLQSPPTPWHTPPTLSGAHVTLEPLTQAHAADLFTALDDEEGWRHLTSPRPTSPAQMAAIVAGALDNPARVAFVQRDARTGEIIGTTSYYDIDPVNRGIAIGFTQVARARRRTPVNTEAKLLLMGHAFDALGAMRITWHTDIRNERSQRAIERLGATREGVLRAHKLRPDGTWRDTVVYSLTRPEWPAARARLTAPFLSADGSGPRRC